MKNKKNIILFIAGIAIFIVILIIILRPGESSESESFKKKLPVNWGENYHHKKKSPYGTFIFSSLINKYYSDLDKRIEAEEFDTLYNDTTNTRKFIMFDIMKDINYTDSELEFTLELVSNGHSVFLSAETFGHTLNEIIQRYFITRSENDRTEIHEFYSGNQIKYPFNFYNEEGINEHYWNYFTDKYEIDTTIEYYDEYSMVDLRLVGFPQKLIRNESGVVLIKIPYGKGEFFFHNTPVCFANISLLNERNVEYLENILSQLPDAELIYETPKMNQRPPSDPSAKRAESPLMFILTNPSLKWAYYLLLITLLIFIIFRMKRRQRIIPGRKREENSAVEFADTLGKLYFSQGKHIHLVRHKEKLLYHFIRQRYFIYSKSDDPKFLPLLQVKSNISSDQLHKLFSLYESAARQSDISDDQLLEIHSLTDYFYKNCK